MLRGKQQTIGNEARRRRASFSDGWATTTLLCSKQQRRHHSKTSNSSSSVCNEDTMQHWDFQFTFLMRLFRLCCVRYLQVMPFMSGDYWQKNFKSATFQPLQKKIWFIEKGHYSKSQIFIQNFNFDKTPTFWRVFHSNCFLTIFSWNQSCQQLKSPKPQHFFTQIFFRHFSRQIKVEFLDKKWRFQTVCSVLKTSKNVLFWRENWNMFTLYIELS